MIKRYHEAPICIFNQVQALTDGDYALVHLFESNHEYFARFRRAVEKGRDVLLDNSIFELGTAFDSDRYAYWIDRLQPTWYIVPDSWKNSEQTIEMFNQFVSAHKDLPGKRVGVAQGTTIDEVIRSYMALESRCDMIAFNLDFSSIFYNSFLPEVSIEAKQAMIPYCVAMSIGRYYVLRDLYTGSYINKNKPHHLLGCGVPQEVQWYPKYWTWIRSIDTSNPVSAGIAKWEYDSISGISKKSDLLMCDHMDDFIDAESWNIIKSNITIMKDWCN